MKIENWQDLTEIKLEIRRIDIEQNQTFNDLMFLMNENLESLPSELKKIIKDYEEIKQSPNILSKLKINHINETKQYSDLIIFISQNLDSLSSKFVKFFKKYAELDNKKALLEQLLFHVCLYLNNIKSREYSLDYYGKAIKKYKVNQKKISLYKRKLSNTIDKNSLEINQCRILHHFQLSKEYKNELLKYQKETIESKKIAERHLEKSKCLLTFLKVAREYK